ncbi:MAG: response regulator transcription factor [Acidobacteriota bacterium]|nr:response regulator transcription factor [Blastocatellia bacterium]MDW8412238.1 response regulator transcription factor [Acidobacteriota bacterium]
MLNKYRILIVEDDEDIADNIKYNLDKIENYEAVIATSGEQSLELAEEENFALIILDLNLPGMTGYEICRRLRKNERTARIPILMLSARTSEDDKVQGFDYGADDYVTKPFSMRELKARVSALLKRSSDSITSKPFNDGRLFIDFDQMKVKFESKPVTLTRKEFQLLRLLIENRGRILTRETLLERVWGLNYLGESRTIDVHVSRLRQKLGGDTYIETVVGLGYRFKEEEGK